MRLYFGVKFLRAKPILRGSRACFLSLAANCGAMGIQTTLKLTDQQRSGGSFQPGVVKRREALRSAEMPNTHLPKNRDILRRNIQQNAENSSEEM